jgi:hypothetical protein
MVLLGVRHWSERLPVWNLLQQLARGRVMADFLHLVDTVDEAVKLVTQGA